MLIERVADLVEANFASSHQAQGSLDTVLLGFPQTSPTTINNKLKCNMLTELLLMSICR